MTFISNLIANLLSVITYTMTAIGADLSTVLTFAAAMVSFFAAIYILIDVCYFVGVSKR